MEEEFKTLHGPREQLEYIAQVHLESHAVNRSMAILMQTEMRQSAKFIAEFSHHHLVKYIQVVREVVRRGQQEGIFRRDVSDGVVAHCMFGAIDELLSSAVFTGRVYDAKATAAQVMDVLLNGIERDDELETWVEEPQLRSCQRFSEAWLQTIRFADSVDNEAALDFGRCDV